MLNDTELMAEWKIDCTIDRTQLLDRMSRHPMLHSKYLTHLQTYKLKIRTLTLKYQKQRMIKTRYYNGELDQESLVALNLKQYQYKRPMKSELESLLDADSDLQLIQEQILYLETLVSATESILKDITNQYFLLKTLVDFIKFEAGV